jgi:hypothetical protein
MPEGDLLIDKVENLVGLSQGLGVSCTTLLVIDLDILRNSIMLASLEGHGLM